MTIPIQIPRAILLADSGPIDGLPAAREWTTADVFAFWERIGHDRMRALLDRDGRKPGAFDRHVALLDDAVCAASSDTLVNLAGSGANTGYLRAALD